MSLIHKLLICLSMTLLRTVLVFLLLVAFSGQVAYATEYDYAPTTTNTQYQNDTKIKKYDAQLQKLQADMQKLQKEYAKVYAQRSERLSQLGLVASKKEKEDPLKSRRTDSAQKLANFPSAGVTWREQYYKNETPPLNAFQAFYFDTKAPKKEVSTNQVERVDVNYGISAGPKANIVSEDFGAYWIGDFTLSKDQEMLLDVSQSWSETRVILDGRLVYKGGNNATVKILVPKGRHTLEVEYVNNWHTVEFSVSLKETASIPSVITKTDISKIKHKEIWYAGVYESGSEDNVIRLLPKGGGNTPKILFLSSYSAVKWDAALLKNTGISTIIYDSFDPGAQVLNVPAGVSVYKADIPYGYTFMANCRTNDRFGLAGCSGLSEFTQVYSAVTKLSKVPLTGFSGAYSPKDLSLPGTALTPAVIKEALEHPAKLRAEAEKYQKSQTIDSIF